MTGLALGLSFAGLNYASAEEQPTPVNEATVEAIIKEGAIDVEAPATSEATTKPTENTTTTASSEAATVSETPVVTSEVASTETVSEKPSSEVSSTASSEVASPETTHSEVGATTSESVTAENVSPTTSDTDTPNSQVPLLKIISLAVTTTVINRGIGTMKMLMGKNLLEIKRLIT